MSVRYKFRAGLAVLALIVLVASSTRASATPTATAAATSSRPEAVGALFTLGSDGALGSHFCTATVVK
jgi:hypothetical protein